MPEKSGFFDTTADDPRQYPAREFAEYFSRFIGNGIFGGGTNLKVTATGTDNKVSIQTGWAWINGYLYSVFGEPLSLTIPLATSMDRIDRIVLRLNVSTPVRSIKAMVLQGTPSVNPTPPAIVRSGDIYDISLAQVRMVANEATVQPGNIVDERLNTSLCGIVTGVVEQADTTTIFNEFDQYRQQKQIEFAQAWNTWFATATANFEGDWDTWFDQTKQDWQDWFDDAQDLLIPDGSVTDAKLSDAPENIKARFSAHASRTDNPHGVTKSQVGLGSVQNYGVASQAQAQAGSANNVYMTPLRTKNYVDTRLLNNIKFRMNGGTLEYNDGTGWKPVVGFDPTSMTLNMMNGQSSVSLQPNTHVDIFSINGAGVLAELELVLNPTNSGESLSYTGVVLVVDGVEKPMYSGNGRTVWTPGFYFNSDSSRTPFSVVKTSLLVKFNTSLKVRVKNLYTGYSAEQSFTWALKGGYYS